MVAQLSTQDTLNLARLFQVGRNLQDRATIDVANTDVPVLTSGKDWSFQVDKIDNVARIRLRHLVTFSTGGTPGTPSVRIRSPSEGLGRIFVYCNGNLEFQVDSDLAFLIGQYYRWQEPLEIVPTTNALLATGSTFPTSSIVVPIDFAIRAIEPQQGGIINVGNAAISSIQVKGTAGVVANYMDSPGATQAISAQSIQPILERYVMPPALFPGKMESGIPPFPGFGAYWRKTWEQPIPSTGNYNVKFTSGRQYLGIAIRTVGGATSLPSDAILTPGTKVTVYANGVPVFDDYVEAIASRTGQHMPTGGVARTGFYFLDFLRLPYKASQAIQSSNQELLLSFSGTTTTNAYVYAVPVVLSQMVDAATARNIPIGNSAQIAALVRMLGLENVPLNDG